MPSNGKGPLYSWLRRVPQPSMLNVDGKRVAVVGGTNKWSKLLETLEAMQPSKIEALDGAGNVIRATEVGDESEPDAPTESALDLASKETSRDVQLARVVLEASDRGAKQNAEAFRLAMQGMADVMTAHTGLVQVLAERLGGLERAWQESLQNRAADLANIAATGGEDGAAGAALVQMLGTIAQSQQGPRVVKGGKP